MIDGARHHAPRPLRRAVVDGPAHPEDLVLGVMDEGGRVELVSANAVHLLGVAATDLVGASLVELIHPEDAGAAASAIARAIAERTSIGLPVAMGRPPTSWVLLSVAPVVGTDPRVGFSISGLDASTEAGLRTSRLEQHLWRIAREIEAAGLELSAGELPAAEVAPELAELSPRQWDVLRRLLDGERVPGIARALYLSPSTVRNHLTAIFAKVGVHSQEELIHVLKARAHPGDPHPEEALPTRP